MELKSNAKINIGLHVFNKRKDGFHNIATIFQEINFFDIVNIREAQNFSCKTNIGQIKQEDNFGTMAFHLIKEVFPDIPNVNIDIQKNIPINAGLGGGSSNGTAILKGLNSLFDLSLNNDQLSHLASKLSSDSTFFVNGGLQLGIKKGEELSPIIKTEIPNHILLVYPNIKINTKDAFNQLKNHLLN